MNKWDYITLISKMSNIYGDLLVDMMNEYNKSNLQEIKFREVKKFYEKLIDKMKA